MKDSNSKGINAIYPFAILCIIARTIGETLRKAINYPPFLVFIEYISYLSFPLLLYLFTNTIKQKNLKLLTLRLYIVGMACGIFRSVLNYILLDISNVSMGIENFIFVLFFIVVCLLVVQLLCDGVEEKNIRKCIYAFCIIFFAFVIPFLFHGLLYDLLSKWVSLRTSRNYSICNMFHDICVSLFPTPMHCGVSFMWIVVGIAMYYTNSKKQKSIVFILVGILTVVRSYFPVPFSNFAEPVKAGCMIAVVLPLIILFDNKDCAIRRSFYVYYPLQSCVCFMILFLLNQRI